MTKKRILVFQHLAIEHPGVFLAFFKEDGIEHQVVDFSVGDEIPVLENFDALWVMGGPMDVWQQDVYPWLIAEKAAIRHAVKQLGMPFMGICLGHQLLSDAMGGEVGPGESEVGISEIHKTDAGKQNIFLTGVDETCRCLQWHGAEVKQAPAGFEVLMYSDKCKVQAMAYGDKVFSMQYHQEIIASTVNDWSTIPEYKDSLEATLGVGAVVKLNQDVMQHMDEFNNTARILYNNWKSAVFTD